MADKTKIQWTDATWGVYTGCDKVSAGCKNCYAETLTERFRGVAGHYFENGFDLTFREDKLDLPLRWKKPRMVFVNSLSDLFHKDIPLDNLLRIFDVMNRADHHIFQILTKRHERLVELKDKLTWSPNIWMGVSVEDQENTKRIEYLQQVPAAVRFLSIEPLIGHITEIDLFDIYWVIVGGESGSGARPMKEAWAKELIELCGKIWLHEHDEDGLDPQDPKPVFVKQMGSVLAKEKGYKDRKGGDISEWPQALQVRQYPKQYYEWVAKNEKSSGALSKRAV